MGSSDPRTELDGAGSQGHVGRIVVGADGSPSSRKAVSWAARQAALTGDVLQLVVAWHWPVNYGYPVPLAPHYDPAAEAFKLLDEELAAVRQQYPGLEVQTAVVQGAAAQILVELSAGADLVVVGTRGHGEIIGLVIGSVSEHCVAHAHCPVVVVRADKPRDHPAGAGKGARPASLNGPAN